MLSRLSILLLLLIAVFAVSAGAATLTVHSPTEGQAFSVGDEIPIDVELTERDANETMRYIYVYSISGGTMISVFQNVFYQELTRYTTTIPTISFSPGETRIQIVVHYRNSRGFCCNGTSKTVTVFFNESPTLLDANAAVNVVRVLPDVVYAGGLFSASLIILPNTSFPGIILKEDLPPRFGFVGTIEGSPWGFGEATVDDAGDVLKILLRKATGITTSSISYNVRVPNDAIPGSTLTFDGNWVVENASGLIIGDDSARIGGFRLPDCPLSDQELLEFVRRWANSEIDNNQILQVIERWKSC